MNVLDYKEITGNNSYDFKDINIFTTKKDEVKSPEENLYDACAYYNINQDNIAACIQVHSNNVIFVDKPGIYKNIDGLVTFIDSGVILKIQTADCVPIFMIDLKNSIIGLVHSGWRGTKDSIVISALKEFKKHGSKTNNIEIYIGPCIKECCYEVKEDVSQFFNKRDILNKNNKLFLNLISKIKYDLYNYGVKKIYESDMCTFHNNEFHSFRREKGGNARMYSIIGKR